MKINEKTVDNNTNILKDLVKLPSKLINESKPDRSEISKLVKEYFDKSMVAVIDNANELDNNPYLPRSFYKSFTQKFMQKREFVDNLFKENPELKNELIQELIDQKVIRQTRNRIPTKQKELDKLTEFKKNLNEEIAKISDHPLADIRANIKKLVDNSITISEDRQSIEIKSTNPKVEVSQKTKVVSKNNIKSNSGLMHQIEVVKENMVKNTGNRNISNDQLKKIQQQKVSIGK